METTLLAIGLGLVSGVLALLAYRLPWLGWVMLTPLCAAIYLFPPGAASLAGAITSLFLVAPTLWGRMPFNRLIEVIPTAAGALLWGSLSALASLLWPDGVPAWGALIFPLAVMIMSALPRLQGGRLANVLIYSQQSVLPVVHISRLGNDLIVSILLALAASVPALLLVQLPPSLLTIIVALVATLIVASALAFGSVRYRRCIREAQESPRIRVAAVSVDADVQAGSATPAQGDCDVAGTIRRYNPYLKQALAEGARLIVLPEVAVTVQADTRKLWLDALSAWAKQGNAFVASGFFDAITQRNQLALMDSTGALAALYDKQHTVAGGEPKRQVRMQPVSVQRPSLTVSGVICYDLDYDDLLKPISRVGGVLVVPANDWKEFEELHHQAAIWGVVMAGVPIVRSTGHGISAVYDAAGRVLARASSFKGPVVLVADVPIAPS